MPWPGGPTCTRPVVTWRHLPAFPVARREHLPISACQPTHPSHAAPWACLPLLLLLLLQRIAAVVALKEQHPEQQQQQNGSGGGLTLGSLREWATDHLPKYQARTFDSLGGEKGARVLCGAGKQGDSCHQQTSARGRQPHPRSLPAPAQLPSELMLVPTIPRNAMGKVNKKALLADLFPEAAAAAAPN